MLTSEVGAGQKTMANLYITEQGSVLCKTGERLVVRKEDEILLDVQCDKIDAVLIFGNVQFTTQAVRKLFEHNIELALLTRTGRLIGQLTPPMPKNIELRMTQYERYKDKDFVLRISKAIVTGKLKNSLQVLRRFSYNHPEVKLDNEAKGLERLLIEIQSKSSIPELMGIEGSGAKIYFAGFSKMMRGEFDFKGRKKRPAPDPVNALLSFGYTLLFNEISSFLDGIGFDPYIGFFHRVDYGRPSLAADLIEEFRAPAIDRLTLRLVNNHIFTLEDFSPHPKSGSMYLKREKMRRYLEEYEIYISYEFDHPEKGEKSNLRKCFREQIYKLAQTIMEKKDYLPFYLERK